MAAHAPLLYQGRLHNNGNLLGRDGDPIVAEDEGDQSVGSRANRLGDGLLDGGLGAYEGRIIAMACHCHDGRESPGRLVEASV